MFPRGWRTHAVICLGMLGAENSGIAQTNSWTNAASGYWEQPYWSLGVPPAPNMAILFTNSGWKALAIGPNTANNHPQTLSIASLTISSPTNSFNELLLNYAGFQTPLVVGDWRQTGSLMLTSNSTIVMLYSALLVSNQIVLGQERGAFSVGGTFDQGENSQVTAAFLNVGNVGPGAYNLTNGIASIGREQIGGNFPARFNQFGGTNLTGTNFNRLCPSCEGLQLLPGGQYNLYDGYFEGSVSFENAGFTQYGGVASATLDFINGSYHLAGGTLFAGGLMIPQYPDCAFGCDSSGTFLQTGGTNYLAYLMINGVDTDPLVSGGSYSLADGVLFAGSESIGPGCAFSQSGGLHFNSAGIELNGTYELHGPKNGSFNLSGGHLETPGIAVNFGFFTQSGGTNLVSGDITLSGTGYGASQHYSLSSGQLSESNLTVSAGPAGASFDQGGGVHSIANQLVVSGQLASDFALRDGTLTVPNIELASGAVFHHIGGTLTCSGTLTLALGTWDEQTTRQEFGPLLLGYHIENYYSGGTNSTLSFPANSCLMRFAESRTLVWSNNSALVIEGWNGTLSGNGKHQLVFGSNSNGLSSEQLGRILFHNPAGNAGMYPATFLGTGEVVPRRSLGIQTTGASVILNWGGNLALETATNVLGPYQILSNAQSPFGAPLTNPSMYFRLRAQ